MQLQVGRSDCLCDRKVIGSSENVTRVVVPLSDIIADEGEGQIASSSNFCSHTTPAFINARLMMNDAAVNLVASDHSAFATKW
jgi:hypothetical protein